jgi:hypothetical protein
LLTGAQSAGDSNTHFIPKGGALIHHLSIHNMSCSCSIHDCCSDVRFVVQAAAVNAKDEDGEEEDVAEEDIKKMKGVSFVAKAPAGKGKAKAATGKATASKGGAGRGAAKGAGRGGKVGRGRGK